MICLTVDIDWAHNEVLHDTLDLLAVHQARATFFATHETQVLEEIRSQNVHELGLHPNFNPLLEGQGPNAREVLQRLKDVVPEAVSVRSHSLVRSSRLSMLFADEGLTHESNVFLPPAAGADVTPWHDFCGLIQVAIRWEDDVRLMDPSLGEPVDHLGLPLLVVDVHPIHVFLNTTSISDYEASKPYSRDVKRLREMRRPAGCGGTRDRLLALLAATHGRNQVLVRELRPEFE